MAKKTDEKELATTTPAGSLAAAPEFMGSEKAGSDIADQYRLTPYLKIVQGQSKPELKQQFPEGSVLLTPENLCLAEVGQEFVVIPIVMFTTFEKWAHLKDKEAKNVVLEKTSDPTHDLALRARDFERRYEDYPDGRKDEKKNPLQYRYVESINVVFWVDGCDHNPDLVGSAFMYSFNKGEFIQGKRFCTSVSRRNKSIFGCRFALKTEIHNSRDGDYSWYGFAHANPTEEQGGAWVTDAPYFEQLKTQHENFIRSIEAGAFEYHRAEEGEDETATTTDMPPI